MQCIVTPATGVGFRLSKSVLMYTFLVMDTYHLGTLCSREQGRQDPWLFFESKRVPRAKQFGKHWLMWSGGRET